MDTPKITVGFTAVAESHLSKLPLEEQKKTIEYVKRMAGGATGDAAPLRQVNGLIWRKKLGDIRILFTYDVRNREVVIRAILWRREDTYDDLKPILVEAEAQKNVRQKSKKEKIRKEQLAKRKEKAKKK